MERIGHPPLVGVDLARLEEAAAEEDERVVAAVGAEVEVDQDHHPSFEVEDDPGHHHPGGAVVLLEVEEVDRAVAVGAALEAHHLV